MRVLLYLVVGVIILSLLRSVVEAIGKAFSSGPNTTAASRGPGENRGQAPQALKKDPVCGTFVSAATAMQKSKGGETFYFCSAECRDKF
jgi:YHS domain-containing protein